MSLACEALGVPVVGGNVSFYNQTDDQDIHPTPIVGYLGMADPMPTRPPRLTQAEEGMEIWVFGPDSANLSGSSYAKVVHDELGGRPDLVDDAMAVAVIDLAATLAEQELAPVLHDVSDGGLAVAISEICIKSAVGAQTTHIDAPFSEPPHRFVAVLSPNQAATAKTMAQARSVPASRLGIIGGDTIALGSARVSVAEATEVYRSALPRRMA